jgi:hypothetical protein
MQFFLKLFVDCSGTLVSSSRVGLCHVPLIFFMVKELKNLFTLCILIIVVKTTSIVQF